MTARHYRLPWTILVSIAAVGTSLVAWGILRNRAATQTGRPQVFYGSVVDGNAIPIAETEIQVRITSWVPNPTYPGYMESNTKAKQFSVYTDVWGRFRVLMWPPDQILTIVNVQKSGYQWVFDWAWTLRPEDAKNDNRQFELPGPVRKGRLYFPNESRPAVFPLLRHGDSDFVALPSRGGSEAQNDGRIVANEPTAVIVPSCGPGAPKSQKEIEARLGEYNEMRNSGVR
jgi:hypothetical protein